MLNRAEWWMVVAAVLLASAPDPVAAACRVTPIAALPGPAPTGSFTLVEAAGVRTIRLADVETLPLVRIEGCLGFPKPTSRFEGVLLADFLQWIGAGDVATIEVSGLDNYSALIPQQDWFVWQVILATRGDGRPLSRRERGPARILYPIDQDPLLATRDYVNRSVWLITEIATVPRSN